MTTVERYRPTPFETLSDAPSNARRPHSSSTTLARTYIPPAVPSPPRQSERYSPPRATHFPKNLTPAFNMVSGESNQWLFTEIELTNTPSILGGLAITEERCRRAKGVNFITQAGILLKLPQLTLATASVFFHRFYMRYSMIPEKGGLHHYNIAATALFLATKTEENCRKTREIVIAVAKVAQKNASLIIDEQSKEYWRWRDNILLYEELMLELLTFDVVLQSPYTILYGYLQRLQIEDNKHLRNAAWAFLNDSCLTMLCLMMPAKDIAVAAIYFAARFTSDKIPDDDHGGAWWEQIGGKPDRIVKAIAVMNEFYTENPLRRSENPLEHSPSSFGNEEDLERTRAKGEVASIEQTPSPEETTHSQNGHHQQDVDAGTTTPVVNGVKTADHSSSQSNEAVNPAVSHVNDPFADPDQSGSSDAALKAAANDPATHENNGETNGIPAPAPAPAPTSEEVPAGVPKGSPKRKEAPNAEEPAAKKSRTELEAPVAPKVEGEESEEGELEE